MQGKARGLLEIFFSILIAVLVISESRHLGRFSTLGYAGIFIISLLSAATLFIPAPSWIFVVSMGRILNPYFAGIAAGFGSGIGEITGYVAGKGVSNLTHGGGKYLEYKEWIKKNDLWAIGILAFIPNPLFDIAGLAAGNLGIKMWRFIAACIIGRTFRYILLAYLGRFSEHYM